MEDSDVIREAFATATEEIQGSPFLKSLMEALAISVPFGSLLAVLLGLAFGNVLIGILAFLFSYVSLHGLVFATALMSAKPKKRS